MVNVVRALNLARGVAHDGEGRVLGGHAASVVGDAQIVHAASGDFRLDIAGPRVDGVFHELLHGVHRALHHFARGDLAGGDRIQYMYHRHLLTLLCLLTEAE